MAEQAPPVGRLEKLGYGVGDLASSFYVNFFNIYLLYFFVELGGVGPAAMGLMLLPLSGEMVMAITRSTPGKEV